MKMALMLATMGLGWMSSAGRGAPPAPKATVLFEDPLTGASRPGWRVSPDRFVTHPEHGSLFRLEHSVKEGFRNPPPWVGDQRWADYRVEVEILPEGGFAGIDFHVQDDGLRGCNLHFFILPEGGPEKLQAAGLWGQAAAWKLWPVSQATVFIARDRWLKLRLEAGGTVANVYADDRPEPVYTMYDLPYARGGVRLWAYAGASHFRNLRVTALRKGAVKPLLPDTWRDLRVPGVIRRWQVTSPQGSEFGRAGIPAEVSQGGAQWQELEADDRGVINLSARFPGANTRHAVFARAIVPSRTERLRRAWVTYTDRFKLWCNGQEVFAGPPRGWFDPDREKLGNSRLIPGHFELKLPLKRGANTILVRSEVTEPFGWGFWVRLE